ncbi:hypothetical protein BDP55DRAFT_738020 [Colletotrichum godetiae]|uniref:Uncharacterized protein n=1 Tax=Colletotrichum godetiae TaxID=1209918 RepID=A0AAJ0AQA8_9PEZI|nr:uncharacterized protein BDP55DRAFT_738020 [Colletotrichum godetiae]KAK1688410.1 hypothetical protein BDP55DRAFT_738020 [Colletotrichum godetiae]
MYTVQLNYNGLNVDESQHIKVVNVTTITDNALTENRAVLLMDRDETGDLAIYSGDFYGLNSYNPNWTQGHDSRLPSYLAIFDCFRDLLKGFKAQESTWTPETWSTGEGREVRDRPLMFNTTLAETQELYEFRNIPEDLKRLTESTEGKVYDASLALFGPIEDEPKQSHRSLVESLPELFQNVTISMARMPFIRYNTSNSYSPGGVPVISMLYKNLYVYASEKLWIPYSLATGATTVAVMAALWSPFGLGASFTANFSTILRATREAQLEKEIIELGITGQDPLPKQLMRQMSGNTKKRVTDNASTATSESFVREPTGSLIAGYNTIQNAASSFPEENIQVALIGDVHRFAERTIAQLMGGTLAMSFAKYHALDIATNKQKRFEGHRASDQGPLVYKDMDAARTVLI